MVSELTGISIIFSAAGSDRQLSRYQTAAFLALNPPVTGRFPSQMAINEESTSMSWHHHYNDVIIGTMASQITSLTIIYSTVYSGADQRKHQSSASLAFVWGIHRGPVNSPHKWPVTRKMFPFDDVIMIMWICFSEIGSIQWRNQYTSYDRPYLSQNLW